jgi:hypothetical protein
MFLAVHEVFMNEGELSYKKKTIELNHVIRDSTKEEISSFLTLSDSCILSIFNLEDSQSILIRMHPETQ